MQEIEQRDHFRFLYSTELEDEAAWLEFGAGNKADSVQSLLKQNAIAARNILELGAGTGAVIRECQRRRLAQTYTAIDYSAEAIGFLARSTPLIRTLVADITAPEFSLQGCFDVVIISHVLEHLGNPGRFLKSLTNMSWTYAIAEVPLEDLAAGKIRRWVTGKPPGKEAGHVQFFTAAGFDKLIEDCGLTIVDRRRYAPITEIEALRLMSRRNQVSRLKYLQTVLTGHFLPRFIGYLWSRLYYSHYAVLCTRNDRLRT
jgi:SAM-dependent methyltransferase